MITLDQATKMFQKMVAEHNKPYKIEKVWEIMFDDPIYAVIVVDENGTQFFPGEVFPSIRKRDGAIIDFTFPATG